MLAIVPRPDSFTTAMEAIFQSPVVLLLFVHSLQWLVSLYHEGVNVLPSHSPVLVA